MWEITPLEAMNTTMDIIGAILILILIISIYMHNEKKQNEMLLMSMQMFLIAIVADAGTWTFLGMSGDSVIFELSLLLDYIFMQITLALIHMYIIRSLENRVIFPKWAEFLALVVSTVMGLLWILSKWNGMFYTITEEYGYVHSKYFIWAQIPSAIVIFLDMIIILYNRKKLAKEEMLTWSSYMVFGIFSLVIESVVNIPALYVAISFIFLILYLEINLQKNLIIAKQEAELVESRSKIALSQIKPHFIYNCLAVIQVLVKKNPDIAVESIQRFANFLRGTMDAIDKTELVTFEEEMYTINNYLYLEKLRMDSKLSVVKNFDVNDFRVPALTIQPIVENAIKHGLREKIEGGTVWINTFETENDYIIKISDDGVGFDYEELNNDGKSHIGMKNVDERLKRMCGGHLTMESKPGEGCVATIFIPKDKQFQN